MRKAAAAALAGLAACSTSMEDTPPPAGEQPPAAVGFFSPEQADRGRETFVDICAECHSTSDFHGTDFEWKWRRQTAWNLFREMRRTMPEDFPGVLPGQTYANLVAYILQLNEYPAGGAELQADEEALDASPLGPGVNKTRSNDGGAP
jgi:hypothetical protein